MVPSVAMCAVVPLMAIQPWCKVAADLDSNPKIRRGGNLCRQVYEFALRQNSLPTNPVPGFVRAAELAPWFMADRLMMPEAHARTGLEKCLIGDDELGPLLVREGMSYRIVGWEEQQWGRGKGSDERAAKVAEARARGGKARAESARRDDAGAFAPATSQHNEIVLDQLPADAPAHAGQLDCAGPADAPAQSSCQLDVRRKTVDERRETVEKNTDSPPARAKRVTAPPSGEHQECIAEWTSRFTAKHGAGPTWQGGRHGMALKRLLAAQGKAEVVRRMAICFDHPRSFPPQPWDFGTFASRFDELAVVEARTSRSVQGGTRAGDLLPGMLDDIRRQEADERERANQPHQLGGAT